MQNLSVRIFNHQYRHNSPCEPSILSGSLSLQFCSSNRYSCYLQITFCRALTDLLSVSAPRKLLTVDASRMDHSSHFAAIARSQCPLRGSFPLMCYRSVSFPTLEKSLYWVIPRFAERSSSRQARSVVNSLILFNCQIAAAKLCVDFIPCVASISHTAL